MTRNIRLRAVVVTLSLVLAACNAGSDGPGESSGDGSLPLTMPEVYSHQEG